MKKTFAAFVAVATVAGSLATTPASAQRGLGAAVAGGIIGGAIVGGAIAASRPAYGGPVYVEDAPPRPAAWFASASGMVMTGASAASRSATELTDRRAYRARLISKPGRNFGRVFLLLQIAASVRRARSSAAPLRSASNRP